ncbi:TetR family transcriptional regulator [Agrobacterium rubi]|nr:TetR/AcrR family transcriptional regulator [Agrobacterium rubi]MBP1881381.1 AcrR family transcriptional regulator [Agrobacterium rubi]MCL6655022.1 TetR family transcriptional regulator [Agrobacterium rubi]
MSSSHEKEQSARRIRLTRDKRHRQLMDVAWKLIHDEGANALTLGRLSEKAGVTKPVVYDQFGSREGLLAQLYQEFDANQTAIMDEALRACEARLADIATVIASSYVNCVSRQGREIPGIVAALTGSPELAKIKKQYEQGFLEKCRALLAPYAPKGVIPSAALWAMLGAAEALSNAATNGNITAQEATDELFATIVAMVERGAGTAPKA